MEVFPDAVIWESLVGCLADLLLIMSDALPTDIFSLALIIVTLCVMFFQLADMFQKLFREYG